MPSFLSGWGKRKAIKYGTVFPGSNLTDFPVLLKIAADSDIAAELASGGGIAITAADGTTLIPFGVYASVTVLSTGDITIRFKVSPLAAASTGDVMAYLYFDASKSTTEDKPNTVSSYDLYCPLEEDPGGSAPQILDWKSNTNKGTSSGGMASSNLVTEQVGKGLAFDGSNDCINFGDLGYSGATKLTISAIYDRPATNVSVNIGNAHSTLSNGNNQVGCIWFTDGNVYVSTAGTGANQFAQVALAGTGKHQIAMVYDGTQTGNSNRLKLYIDGVLQTLSFTGGTVPSSLTSLFDAVTIGRDFSDRFGGGSIDEFRISIDPHGSDWVAYAYQVDFHNSDVVTLGTLETSGGGTITIGLTALNNQNNIIAPIATIGEEITLTVLNNHNNIIALVTTIDEEITLIALNNQNNIVNPNANIGTELTLSPLSNNNVLVEPLLELRSDIISQPLVNSNILVAPVYTSGREITFTPLSNRNRIINPNANISIELTIANIPMNVNIVDPVLHIVTFTGKTYNLFGESVFSSPIFN